MDRRTKVEDTLVEMRGKDCLKNKIKPLATVISFLLSSKKRILSYFAVFPPPSNLNINIALF